MALEFKSTTRLSPEAAHRFADLAKSREAGTNVNELKRTNEKMVEAIKFFKDPERIKTKNLGQ